MNMKLRYTHCMDNLKMEAIYQLFVIFAYICITCLCSLELSIMPLSELPMVASMYRAKNLQPSFKGMKKRAREFFHNKKDKKCHFNVLLCWPMRNLVVVSSPCQVITAFTNLYSFFRKHMHYLNHNILTYVLVALCNYHWAVMVYNVIHKIGMLKIELSVSGQRPLTRASP